MNYRLSITSDSTYERLIAELEFSDGSIVVVSQERDNDSFEIGFYAPHRDSAELVNKPMLVDLEVFMTAIAKAKERLQLLDVSKASAD
ncbi:hypothetical protein [Shinella sp. M31]|uniref:hypothetical protein n=1 Tax=Shinella sp. M31 TaxID=3368615 RepID=UPI003BA3A905